MPLAALIPIAIAAAEIGAQLWKGSEESKSKKEMAAFEDKERNEQIKEGRKAAIARAMNFDQGKYRYPRVPGTPPLPKNTAFADTVIGIGKGLGSMSGGMGGAGGDMGGAGGDAAGAGG